MAKSKKLTFWKRTVIVLGIVIGIPLLTYGIAEYSYQLRVQKLTSAVNTFGNAVLKPLGGVSEDKVGITCPYFFGWFASHFDDRGPCPRAGRSWLIPVSRGQEKAFIPTILTDGGYSSGTMDDHEGGGVKNGIGIDVDLIDSESIKYLSTPPVGKVWMRVSLDAKESAKH